MKEEEIEKFIKTPEIGNKVKVYYTGNRQRYGFVKKVIVSEQRKREILILEESERDFELQECDFCLEKGLVVFNKENKEKDEYEFG